MARPLRSGWSESDVKKGARQAKAWMDFFAGEEWTRTQSPAGSRPSRIAKVRAKHEAELMRYPNVVGVSEGIEVKRGKPTGKQCIVVYVKRKVPKAKLAKRQILPERIEGVPVDVVEVGLVGALPK
jgi:hypothetical protein